MAQPFSSLGTHQFTPTFETQPPATKFMAGYYYHIYNHAAQNSLLFKTEADYQYCLALMKQHLGSADFSMVAFCLMPNHYHFFLRQNSDYPIYEALNRIWLKYSKYYNFKHKGKGSIFSGKAKHKHVDSDSYLLRLSAYIHQNPVSAGFVNKPEDWKWSNYLEWIGARNTELCDYDICRNYYQDQESYKKIMDEIASEKEINKFMLD